jgi:hypothetical protein
MEQCAMPCHVHGKTRALRPRRFGRCEKRKPLAIAALHLHHMGRYVHRPTMHRLEFKGAARHLFGALIIAILLKAESTSSADAGRSSKDERLSGGARRLRRAND